MNLHLSRMGAQTVFTTFIYCALLFPLARWSGSPAVLAAAAAVPVAPVAAPVAAVPAVAPAPVHAPVPAPKPLTLHEKVVGSLRAAGHYGAIAGLIDSLPTANSIVKTGVTLFAPNDNAFSGVLMNSSDFLLTLLGYHATPKVYSYQELLTLPAGTKVPTSAPNVAIVVTNSVQDSYKLDDSLIVDKDIFVDSTVAVHGIDSILDTAKYNKGAVAPEAAPAPVNPISPIISSPPAPPVSDTPVPPGDSSDGPSLEPSAPETAKNPNAASVTNMSLLSSIVMTFLVCLLM